MAKLKKFGTFGGVFTPSILTILGVIMYLRLPWIAGQSGLLVTIGIVLLAHLISVTTGLSVSSIATDKKVKAGGTYYMISRSLGLPIGGTLGLALFVGLSFSVSLYLIGFAESFLNFWGFEATKNSIRLAGTLVLISVTIITFISTSLAIKTQYFIMTAIILSLLSIFFGNHGYVPTEPLIKPIADAAPFIVLFGIFFPAVTGFEAGVSMSGDLQDSKKSIPVGTITAIAIGLVVYIILAFFFSYTVSSDLLANDPNALLKISLIPELVVAGIWGATLSSAFGSILGAPRILQATSVDKITHKFFSKGYGSLNEPRNALLLTFIIAEAGILIGDLDVIARIVSMFFITTYGFLNLSCAIESWASSDFRPEFKIPKWVSILGAAACLIVMVQLDFVAMVGATVLLGSLFIYLTRKQLKLETGDTWDSVWSSIVRKGLAKLSQSKSDTRNWRPNIILFSGGSQARPYIVEMGKWLTGKLGILSNFHLIEDKSTDSLFKISEEKNPNAAEGVFTRNFVSRNVYEGIDVITRVYGFSGVEPNTILMGWARNTDDPDQFAKLIKNFNELDLNSLFIDYDKEKGFGEKKRIDVWWRGAGNNFALELALVRFLSSTNDWRDAEVRFIVISQNSSIVNRAYKNLTQIIEQYRINATVRIINNEIEQRKPVEIILSESAESDLILFGIPDISEQNSQSFINSINELTANLGTVLLVRASSKFEELSIGIQRETDEIPLATEQAVLPEIRAQKNDVLEKEVKYYNSKVEEIYSHFISEFSNDIFSSNLNLLQSYNDEAFKRFDLLEKKIDNYAGGEEKRRLVLGSRNDLVYQLNSWVDELIEEQEKINESLASSLITNSNNIKNLKDGIQKKIPVFYDDEDLRLSKSDKFYDKLLKKYLGFKASTSKLEISNQVRIGDYCAYYFDKIYAGSFTDFLGECETLNYKILTELQNSHTAVLASFDGIMSKIEAKEATIDLLRSEKEKFGKLFSDRIEFVKSNLMNSSNSFMLSLRNNFQFLLNDLENVSANSLLRRQRKLSKKEKDLAGRVSDYSQIWTNNCRRILNLIYADLLVEKFKGKVLSHLAAIKLNVSRDINSFYFNKAAKIGTEIQNHLKTAGVSENKIFDIKFDDSFDLSNLFNQTFEKIREEIIQFPEELEIITEQNRENEDRKYLEETESININLRKIVDYNIESVFIESLYIKINETQRDLIKNAESVKNIVGLLNFNMQNSDMSSTPELSLEQYAKQLLESTSKKIDTEVLAVSEIKNNFLTFIDELFLKSFEPLSSYRLVKTSLELGTQVREISSKKFVTKLSEIKDKSIKFVKDASVSLLYKKSEGILLANKMYQERKKEVSISDLMKLTESLTPNQKILHDIPFYYKKLFSGKATASKELWVGRESEIKECEKAVQRFKQNQKGGLLIIGERNFGKSSLASYIAEKNFGAGNFFYLNPEPGGSINLEQFESKMQKALASEMNIDDKLHRTAKKSVMIINDLELWWERSENGFQIIDRITELINTYGHKWFFIITANIHSYSFVRKIKPIDHHFLNIVSCEPYDAESLKDIVLLRHKASGMRFTINGEELSELKLARLFNAYFNYSNGNLGTALNGWVCHIKKNEGNILSVGFPTLPDISVLNFLPDKWILIILQLIVHRRLHTDRLSKIMIDDIENGDNTISQMKSSGIIHEYSKNILEVNPFVEPFIINHLIKAEIL